MTLDEAPEAFDLLSNHPDRFIKIVLLPGHIGQRGN
jgi:hypothetical protein